MGMRCAGLALVAVVALGGAARAETLAYSVDLSGAKEVPPNTSPGTGHADVTYDTTTRAITWRVTYANLTGPVLGMHFHGSVPPGQNAGILLPFKGSLASPVSGSAVLTQAQGADFLAGKWYINAHTRAHPGGELRAQVTR